jgi:TatD DNase family protein
MIDIHTHLHFKDYDADRDAVIARAREAGVEKMILVGTDLESSCAAVELSEKHDFLRASVGVHPHEFVEDAGCKMQDAGWASELKELAKHPKVVAIGECGLDYFVHKEQGTINSQQRSIQRDGFLAQMEIAKELGLPMIIHTRPSAGTMDAYEDIFEILADSKFKIQNSKFVLHCYQGDTEITKKFLSLPNVYFSFAGSITYPVKKALVGTKDDPAEILKMIPMERMFVETDCPYLTPQPMRGSRNEPAYVQYTLEGIAVSKAVDTDTAEKRIEMALLSVFRGLVV